jgi:hypothetical protein
MRITRKEQKAAKAMGIVFPPIWSLVLGLCYKSNIADYYASIDLI